MKPYVHILGMHFPTYSLMIGIGALSFLLYYIFVVKKQEKLDRITFDRLIFVSVIGFAVLGVSAYIFNAIFHSIAEGKLVTGGITWLGGVLGLFPAMFFLIHKLVPKEKGNAVNRFSTLLPGLVIAHAFGRVGCFFGGCCYGGPTSTWLGVVYPAGSHAGTAYPDILAEPVVEIHGEVEHFLYPSVPLLPTQLIEALFEMLLFIVMLVFYKKLKHYNIEIYCFAYGVFRFILEFWRADDRGDTGLGLSPSQLMSILLIIGGVLLILFRNGVIFKALGKKCEIWRERAKTLPAGSSATSPFNSAKRTTDAIKELHDLMKAGVITKEEFEEKKADLLKRL